jgi:hypothetical protein
MSDKALTTTEQMDPETLLNLADGDLSGLTDKQKVAHYVETCQSLGLNHRTGPFQFMRLNGKIVLYAKRDAADQLRHIHGVSTAIVDERKMDSVYIVRVRATDKTGRYIDRTGAVGIAGMKGDSLANAIMKAETKADRRATLALCGLGLIDETEVETVPGAVSETMPPVSDIIDVEETEESDAEWSPTDALADLRDKLNAAGISEVQTVRYLISIGWLEGDHQPLDDLSDEQLRKIDKRGYEAFVAAVQKHIDARAA